MHPATCAPFVVLKSKFAAMRAPSGTDTGTGVQSEARGARVAAALLAPPGDVGEAPSLLLGMIAAAAAAPSALSFLSGANDHTRMVWSLFLPEDRIWLPSMENRTKSTESLWPRRMQTCSPECTDHTRTL